MHSTAKLVVNVVFGLLSGVMVGTIIGSAYLTLALRRGLSGFDMFAVWKISTRLRAAHPDACNVAFAAVILSAVALGLLAFVWTYQKQRSDYGAAHWQTKTELNKNGMVRPVGTGFVCGKLGAPKDSKAKYICSTAIPHVMMVAPTRAGKGVGFVIPNILSFGGSIVALDVKGENFDKTARYRMIQGDEVYRFSPFDWVRGTHRYNPLDRIAKCKSFAEQFTEVSILADLFLDKDNQQSNTFSEAGKTIFVAACLLALQRRRPNLGEVNKIVSDGADKNQMYKSYAEEAKGHAHRLLWINAASASDKLLTSNIQALKTAGLKQWDNPAVVAATSANDMNFSTFRKRPQSLYIVVSEDHIPTLAPLLRLMFADLIASLRANEPGPDEPWPVMVMIDEFQQMGALPYLERAIHTLASYGGRIAMIAQSLSALDKIYGKDGRESLENGAGLKLYITPRDEQTVKEVSASVGKTTREAVTTSFGRNKGFAGAQGTSVRLEERPLLSETEARFMDPDEVIILASPQHPIRAKRIKYFDDPMFAAMMDAQKGYELPFPPLPAELANDPLGPKVLKVPKVEAEANAGDDQAKAKPEPTDEPARTPAPKVESDEPPAPTQKEIAVVAEAQTKTKLKQADAPTKMSAQQIKSDEPSAPEAGAENRKTSMRFRLAIVNNPNPKVLTPPEGLNSEDAPPPDWEELIGQSQEGDLFKKSA
ncbi:type IV secretory system conjugative DNA transfer family protein [Pseudorhodobacter sp.]|uniref:type IV secretory system conjugative DNA transfer family protein n=1 Tax=Pseudorhodobacter sp. TaxID=1934400 RepID=UPI002647DD09|nr:type IV secretory system conjugative DNA transfer family protein [Pseudorhodobacter sp.]MDN5787464.1 type IV secretory system conjugative DNA transfer family protein [Pseudorhodobacter sp.]